MNASGESRKTIVINEGFIDPTGALIHSSSKRKTTANKTLKNLKPSLQSKEISKQVLQRIRERYKNTNIDTNANIDTLEEEPKEQTPVVKNEENRDLIQSIEFLEKLTQNVKSQPQQHIHAKPHEIHRHYAPQYGCLKRGTLPTYKTLLNTTQKYRPIPISHPPPHSIYSQQQIQLPFQHGHQQVHHVKHGYQQEQPVITNGANIQSVNEPPVSTNTPNFQPLLVQSINEPLEQEIKDLSIRRQFAELQQGGQPTITEETPLLQKKETPSTPNYQKRIIRRTHRVGRSKRLPIVSVLLPNKTIRSKVASHSKTLKTLPMPQVKNSLVKTGMIKIGSEAPENVLREIYENMCLIGGPVMNYNPDVLYYNMLHNS